MYLVYLVGHKKTLPHFQSYQSFALGSHFFDRKALPLDISSGSGSENFQKSMYNLNVELS